MKALVVHNSDEVKAVFVGSKETILSNIKASEYWEDITSRLPLEDEEITLDTITELYHDGDSEDGYTLVDPILPISDAIKSIT